MDDTAAQHIQRDDLLRPGEPPPFEIYNGDAGGQLLLICDHASNRVPDGLNKLGLSDAELARHIGWDIGAADVTYRLSQRLSAPAILAGYSRLVIDCNRALDHRGLILPESDQTPVPGNAALVEVQRETRIGALYDPYHTAIADQIERLRAHGAPDEAPVVVSIHSFTPVFDGIERPWHVGILWNVDPRLPEPLIARLREDAALVVGDNEPYSAREGFGHTLETHGDGKGLANALIEVRQDLIDTHHGAEEWAERLAIVLQDTLADRTLFRPRSVG